MATLAEITEQIELGWAYYTEQINALRLKMAGGCFTCTSCDLIVLGATILSLQYDVETENNTSLTTRTYNLLKSMLAGFSGSFTADPTVVNPYLSIISVAADTPEELSGIVSSASSMELGYDEQNYVFTGTTATWTLPPIAGGTWKQFYIKNRGSGILTVNANGGLNSIYVTSAVNTVAVSPGEALILVNDGTYFNLE